MLSRVARKIAPVLLGLGSGRKCPLCGWTGYQFMPRTHPRKPSADAFCPRCGSAERHRFAYVALKDRYKFLQSTLHVSPEKSVTKWLRSISDNYISCDIVPGRAMDAQDLTRLTYPDASFDFLWCSNVLEHIPDDAAAMREMLRVLSNNGTCLVQVPIWRRQTFEDHSVTDPKDRLRLFGQDDHVRLYGLDIEDRLRSAGFSVEAVTTRDFDPMIVGRHGLDYLTTGELFLCTKP